MAKQAERSGRADDSSRRFDSTVKGAVALFGSVTGGVAGVYMLTLSFAITALAVTAALLVLLVLKSFR